LSPFCLSDKLLPDTLLIEIDFAELLLTPEAWASVPAADTEGKRLDMQVFLKVNIESRLFGTKSQDRNTNT